jgi:1-acyl-sn-glycerol-3-phosphate acyltransferase
MVLSSDLQAKPGWSLELFNPEVLQALMSILGWPYHNYFHVQTSGWEQIPTEQNVLLVGSHNGGMAAPDMFMMMYDWYQRFGYERRAYGLMHPQMWKALPPALAKFAAQIGSIQAHPKIAISALRSGASVLVYPGGAQDLFRPHSLRDRICLGDNHAFIKLVLREKVPIVPLISWGAHDTLIILGDIYELVRQLHEWGMPWLLDIDPVVFPIYLGLPWGLGIGPLPNIPFPIPIRTQVCPPITFEWYGRDAANDRAYVEMCYQQVSTQMQQALDQLIDDCRR